jgi:predicted MFS family arabinose efflux permease
MSVTDGPPASGTAPSSTATTMTPGMVALFATACGISVASLYYAQPLLPQISRGFGVGSGTAGLIVTAAQIGYGIGLALIVPLGDILIRRRLVPGILVLASVSLFAASAAPNIDFLIASVAVAGVCSVSAQILVPFAASLASDQQRGRVVGTVMSGLLVGILLARTFSGLIAEVAGWRTVYEVAGVLVLVLAGMLYRRLPGERSRPAIAYAELLGSVVRLMRTEPLLRLRSVIGALAFATFNVVWTSLAFLLAGPPYHDSEAVIGLFGLLGAAGALAASFSGRLADRGLERWVTAGSLLVTVASMALLALGSHHLWALIAGILVVDLGIQSVHIQNQQLIFGIDPSARSRLNTGYMVSYFIGGAIGSAATGLAYAAGGWASVITLGACFSGAGFLVWIVSEVARRRPGETVDETASPDLGS